MDAPSTSGRSSSPFSFLWENLRVVEIVDQGGLSGDEAVAEEMIKAAAEGDTVKLKKLAHRLEKEEKNVATVVDTLAAKPQYKGRGLLHFAASHGKIHMCKFLITKLHLDVDPGAADGTGPLVFAVRSTCKEVVELLLRRGADINKANRVGVTALHAAVLGTYEIAELLLIRQAYVDPVCGLGTPLHFAVASGKSDMLALLLKYGANPNRVVKSEERIRKVGFDISAGRSVTLLAIAARDGFTDGVNYLLEAGADANISDETDRTPIEIAAMHGQRECVEILLLNTSRIAKFADWSVDGIIEHVASDGYVLKAKGDAAFRVKDYTNASAYYTRAIETDPNDTTLYMKRICCWLHTGVTDKALEDANTYDLMMLDSSNSCSKQVESQILKMEGVQAVTDRMHEFKLESGSEGSGPHGEASRKTHP